LEGNVNDILEAVPPLLQDSGISNEEEAKEVNYLPILKISHYFIVVYNITQKDEID
jgi:hypothetical protein